MGLRIVDREIVRQKALHQQLLEEEAARFGAFCGNGSAEFQEEFLKKVLKMREEFASTDDADKAVHQLEEAIRKENKRSMDIVGKIQPNVVLDLL